MLITPRDWVQSPVRVVTAQILQNRAEGWHRILKMKNGVAQQNCSHVRTNIKTPISKHVRTFSGDSKAFGRPGQPEGLVGLYGLPCESNS